MTCFFYIILTPISSTSGLSSTGNIGKATYTFTSVCTAFVKYVDDLNESFTGPPTSDGIFLDPHMDSLIGHRIVLVQ